MRNMRLIGSNIEKCTKQMGLSPEQASIRLGCTREQYITLTKGLMIPTYELLMHYVKSLPISEEELTSSDSSYYDKNFVLAMGEFTILDEREKILDIIEDYQRLISAVTEQ